MQQNCRSEWHGAGHDPVAAALALKTRMDQAGAVTGRALAAGEGWRAMDYVCTCGPRDRAFEEQHALASVSLVLSGTFVCRSRHGESLLSAGSLFLGSVGQAYECSHSHGEGDRCLSFQFEPETFERLARDAGARRASFDRNGLPPLRALAPLAARAQAAMRQPRELEEIAYAFAGAAVRAAGESRSLAAATGRHHARIAKVLRRLGARFAEQHSIADLARLAGISPYHFLRTFKQVTASRRTSGCCGRGCARRPSGWSRAASASRTSRSTWGSRTCPISCAASAPSSASPRAGIALPPRQAKRCSGVARQRERSVEQRSLACA